MPLVCITGDVHHPLGHPRHPMMPAADIQRNEYAFALKYSDIARKYNLKLTLFVTGKCIEQHKQFWKDLSSDDSIEMGAHTYTAFQPFIIHKIFKETLHSKYGPHFYQYLDIKRTLHAFRSIGLKPKAWRTHEYAGNHNTYQLLEKCGFATVSDTNSLGDLKIIKLGSLNHVPITTIPDEKVAYFYFQRMTYNMMAEGQRVFNYIIDSIMERKDMVVTLHPIGVKVLDNFRSFEKVTKMLSEYDYMPVTITELVNRIESQP